MNIAIVTGASSGMGREFVLQLSDHVQVDEIWAIARRADALESLKAETAVPVRPISLDLCDENEKNKQSCARLREEIRLYLSQVEEQQQLRENLEPLQQENKLLREQISQYEAGQIGFNA